LKSLNGGDNNQASLDTSSSDSYHSIRSIKMRQQLQLKEFGMIIEKQRKKLANNGLGSTGVKFNSE
jgi:hypothetical protein